MNHELKPDFREELWRIFHTSINRKVLQ